MQEQLADAHGALQAAEAIAARADRAERDKEQAETGRDDERARADALRERLDDMAAKLADAQTELAAAHEKADAATELRRELDAAQIAPGEAEADAAELRQANTERRARGLMWHPQASVAGSMRRRNQRLRLLWGWFSRAKGRQRSRAGTCSSR